MRPFVIDQSIEARIHRAWANLPADQQKRVQPMLEAAHRAAVAHQQEQVPSVEPVNVGNHFGLLHSVITGDRDGVLASLQTKTQPAAAGVAPAGVKPQVDAEGVIWGVRQYENLDPGWLEAGAVWLEHLPLPKHPFNLTIPATNLQMDARVRIAIAGDWGTGFCQGRTVAAERVRAAIENLNPDFTIHLGDVYYTGISPYEQNRFANIWPVGKKGSLALNSNHEMHPGGGPYFQMLRAAWGNPFSTQGGRSFFALENANWIVVGLDSAYYADKEQLYSDGALCGDGAQPVQIQFLKQQVGKGKKLIVMTHHNPFNHQGDGSQPYTYQINRLGQQVVDAVCAGVEFFWYWGHVHAAAVYLTAALGGVSGRCCGHGGIPWGKPNVRSVFDNQNYVAWWGNQSANDPEMPERFLNGFAVIDLNGSAITERFFDENGCQRYPATS
jgi:hypothetical protein